MGLWIPDFDDFFLAKLATITVPDERGTLKPITATYYLPGKEKSEDADSKRPAIVMSQYDMIHDEARECSAVKLKVGGNSTEVSVKDAPIPMNLYYEFRILSDFKEHNVLMEAQFLRMFPPRGAIVLRDPADGTEDAYDCFLSQVIPGDSYLQTNNSGATSKRIFRRIYRYVVKTETDFGQVETYKRVLDRIISAKKL